MEGIVMTRLCVALRTRLICGFVVGMIPQAAIAQAIQRPTARNDTETYVRVENFETYGIRDNVSKKVEAWRFVWLCDVRTNGELVVSTNRGVAQIAKQELSGTWKWGGYTNRFSKTEKFDLRTGQLPDSFHGRVVTGGFLPRYPFLGFEYFWSPVRHQDVETPTANTPKLAVLSNTWSASTPFKGCLTYTLGKSQGSIQVKGPYYMESANGTYLASGYLERDIDMKSFQFTRMSGNFNFRVHPASEYRNSLGCPKDVRNRLADSEDVVVYVAFQMLPIASSEGKRIEIPAVLSRKMKASEGP
jgi:hypothetical protein